LDLATLLGHIAARWDVEVFFADTKEYNREYLAQKWGYKDWHAIGRGIVTLSRDNKIILFITQRKQKSQRQLPYPSTHDRVPLFLRQQPEYSIAPVHGTGAHRHRTARNVLTRLT